MSKSDWLMAIFGFGSYIIGGLGIFSGLALIFLWPTWNVFGWGEGRPIGYLLLCVGLALSMLGVLLMRILRNRPLQ